MVVCTVGELGAGFLRRDLIDPYLTSRTATDGV